MNPSFKMFKALLWKEYRETRPLLIVMILVALLMSSYINMGLSEADLETSRNYIQNPPQLLNSFVFPYSLSLIFGISLFFFAPLIARESENEVLLFQAVKPISSELFGFYKWIAALLISLIPLIVFMIIIKYKLSWLQSYPPFLPNIFVIFVIGVAILIVTGLFFSFFSVLGANRIQSIALSLFALGLIYAFNQFMESTQTEGVTSLWERFKLMFDLNPVTSALLIVLALSGISLALLCYRMTGSFLHWNLYGWISGSSATIFVTFVLLNVTDRNLTQVRIDKETFLTQVRTIGMINVYNNAIDSKVIRDDYLFNISKKEIKNDDSIIPRLNRNKLKKLYFNIFNIQPISNQQNQPNELYNKPLYELFDLNENIFSHFDYPYRVDDWKIIAGKKRGCIFGYKKSYLNEQMGDYFLIGTFDVSDNPNFSPVYEIQMSFVSESGKQNEIIQCASPGIFKRRDFTKLYERITKEIDEEKLEIHSNQDANFLVSRYVNVMLANGEIPHSNYGDVYTDDRFYWMFTSQTVNKELFPIVFCMDFSDSKRLSLHIGTTYEKPLPADIYFTKYPIHSFGRLEKLEHVIMNPNFLVENNLMIQTYHTLFSEYALLVDLSDPDNMHEITRIKKPVWPGWTNWTYYGSDPMNTSLYEDKFLSFNHNGLYMYTINDQYSLKPFGRLIDDQPDKVITFAKIIDDALYVGWGNNHKTRTVTKYVLGPASGEMTEQANSVEIIDNHPVPIEVTELNESNPSGRGEN